MRQWRLYAFLPQSVWVWSRLVPYVLRFLRRHGHKSSKKDLTFLFTYINKKRTNLSLNLSFQRKIPGKRNKSDSLRVTTLVPLLEDQTICYVTNAIRGLKRVEEWLPSSLRTWRSHSFSLVPDLLANSDAFTWTEMPNIHCTQPPYWAFAPNLTAQLFFFFYFSFCWLPLFDFPPPHQKWLLLVS